MVDEQRLLADIEGRLMDGDAEGTERLIREALGSGLPAGLILDSALLPGMSRVGRLFRDNEVYVPDVILAADAMQAGLAMLRPLLSDRHVDLGRRIVIGSVRNDLHDLGKTIVCCGLIAAGFDVIDLGVNVPAEAFAEALELHRPCIVAMSCTLSYTLEDMRQAVAEVRRHPLGAEVLVVVGGLAVTPAFAASIGADSYSLNADHIVLLAQRLLHEQRI